MHSVTQLQAVRLDMLHYIKNGAEGPFQSNPLKHPHSMVICGASHEIPTLNHQWDGGVPWRVIKSSNAFHNTWFVGIPNILGSIIPQLIINQQGF